MTKMFKIALPDGSVKEMPEGSTPADVAAAIGPGLAKAALAAKINGEIRDITRPHISSPSCRRFQSSAYSAPSVVTWSRSRMSTSAC